MRGKVWDQFQSVHIYRITPAYAGKRSFHVSLSVHTEDHPRLCGEKRPPDKPPALSAWITPAYAGKSLFISACINVKGITPAYAGKSRVSVQCETCHRDHPRLCGEKEEELKRMTDRPGSPPPMRGKVNNSCSSGCLMKDHPRLCGEKFSLTYFLL
mgnify:CR=1 FL=1